MLWVLQRVLRVAIDALFFAAVLYRSPTVTREICRLPTFASDGRVVRARMDEVRGRDKCPCASNTSESVGCPPSLLLSSLSHNRLTRSFSAATRVVSSHPPSPFVPANLCTTWFILMLRQVGVTKYFELDREFRTTSYSRRGRGKN